MTDRYEVHSCDDGEEGWVVVNSETGETLGDELGEVVYLDEALAHAAAKAGRVEMDPSEEDPFADWEPA